MEIDRLRRRIDELDLEIVRLLNERAQAARAIGAAKAQVEHPVYVPDREREVLERVAHAAEAPLTPEAARSVFREIISACRAVERRLTIAYWGPPASNTHVAALRHFGSQCDFLEAGSVAEVFERVEGGAAEFGVAPVENSTDGVIARTLDLFLSHELSICAEIYVSIHHHLLSRAERIEDLKRVYTMFQSVAQCRSWIDRNLRGVELVDTTTTARGAELAASDPEGGAIANAAAAEHYGLRALAENIEDNPRNRTRFWVVGSMQARPSGRDKTSILFAVPHKPGALVRALSVFADHGVTLTFIESRPSRQEPWEYVFFIDVLGHTDPRGKPSLRGVLEEFEQHCLFVRVLGSYPAAD